MTLTYVKAPRTLVPALLPSENVYRVEDQSGRLVAVVAGSGRSWTAGRVGPKRSAPFIGTVWAESRSAAVERLVRGRP